MNIHADPGLGGAGVAPPAPPRALADTGLPVVMMRDLLLKTMVRSTAERVSDLARTICMPIPLTQELIDGCREGGLLQSAGTMHAGAGGEMAYQLTEAGQRRASEALRASEYYGPMPVPLEAYKLQVKRQTIRDIRITRDRLHRAMGHLVLPEGLLDQLGPAVGSGRSVLMYGPPGNGKSSIAEGIRAALGDHIWIPHAVEYAGQVITLYDPIVHNAIPRRDDGEGLRRTGIRADARYILCQRPTVMTGGELTLSMLDLNYNAGARTYQASLQLKSTGGVFIVDDLGRQEEPPQKMINRWIVPMEMGYDILSLQSGEKFEVPFDTLVVFSTNFHPNKIFDVAALRRIFFKVMIDGPSQADFLKIFAMVAKKKKVKLDEASLVHLMKRKYPSIGNLYANYHAPFLLDQIAAICDFEDLPHVMTPELVDRAWANLYVRDADFAH